MNAPEFNFDGIVGPTHNYAGLARGNIASQENRGRMSRPKAAALEGLAKMKLMADLGVGQAVLLPQERPDVEALRRLGFSGSDAHVLARAAGAAPDLLAACSSASGMWAANAATVSPSADTADGRLHLTPANLINHLHRSLETETTGRMLRAIFPGNLFVHHEALPATPDFADEGAANHTRICGEAGGADGGGGGVELFVYGFDPGASDCGRAARRFQGRQSRLASEAIARLHGLNGTRTFYARQHPEAIDAGVFHNDVISVGHRNVFLYHEKAFWDGPALMEKLADAFRETCGAELRAACVPESLLPLKDTVSSYLFNSQLVSGRDGPLILVAPTECRDVPGAAAAVEWIREKVADIADVRYVDVRQSMRNGGGPACLRLRVVLTERERAAVAPGVLFSLSLGEKLRAWVERHYRDELRPQDLADPALLEESRRALDELTAILGLGAVYRFQRDQV